MLELDLKLTAKQVLDECRRRGLVVRSERELATRGGSRHWHLRTPGRPGTLELTEWQNRGWGKVHPLRDGGWATALAHELAAQRRAAQGDLTDHWLLPAIRKAPPDPQRKSNESE